MAASSSRLHVISLPAEILCSAKRMKLLLQPLLSIHVRTEALQLSRLEVWWYLVVRLGPNLGPHFEQVKGSTMLSFSLHAREGKTFEFSHCNC